MRKITEENVDYLSLKDFTEAVKAELEEYYGDDYLISASEILKNNSTRLQGITVRKITECIAPTVYTNDYHKKYIRGISFEDICGEIHEVLAAGFDNVPENPEILEKDPEKLKKRIVYRLVSREMNEDLLKMVPYRKFVDLAVIYYVFVRVNDDAAGSILITNDYMEKVGLTEKELYRLAKANTPKLFPAEINPMGDVLKKLATNAGSPLPDELTVLSEYPMYILSNSKCTNGAVCLLYPGICREIAELIPDGFFVLPSSIHELIIVPTDRDSDELLKMVADVNLTQVPPEDILSNNIYRYYPEEAALKLIKAA